MADCNSTTTESKTCPCCRTEKLFSDYYKDKKTKDGLYSRCKTCHNASASKWASKNKSSIAKSARDRREKDQEKHRRYSREYQAEAYKRNPEKFREISRSNRSKNPDKTNATSAASRAKVPELTAQYQSAYYEKNKTKIKEDVKNRANRLRVEMRPKNCERVMRRNARKKNASPSWANLLAMQNIYEQAARLTRATGVAYHVDHIVPLQGKTVCGLHVENNLQILLKTENQIKGNRLWPDKP